VLQISDFLDTLIAIILHLMKKLMNCLVINTFAVKHLSPRLLQSQRSCSRLLC